MSDTEKKFEIRTEASEVFDSYAGNLFHTRLWGRKRGVAWWVACPLCGRQTRVSNGLSGMHLSPDGNGGCTARFDPATGNCLLPMEDVPRAVARRLIHGGFR